MQAHKVEKTEDLTGTDHHILNSHSSWWLLWYLAPVILMNVDLKYLSEIAVKDPRYTLMIVPQVNY